MFSFFFWLILFLLFFPDPDKNNIIVQLRRQLTAGFCRYDPEANNQHSVYWSTFTQTNSVKMAKLHLFSGKMEMFCIALSFPSINSPGPDIFSTLLLCASLKLQRFELAVRLLSFALQSGCAALSCGTRDWLQPVSLQRCESFSHS